MLRAKLKRCICIQGRLGRTKQHRLVCTAARKPAQSSLCPLWRWDKVLVWFWVSLRPLGSMGREKAPADFGYHISKLISKFQGHILEYNWEVWKKPLDMIVSLSILKNLYFLYTLGTNLTLYWYDCSLSLGALKFVVTLICKKCACNAGFSFCPIEQRKWFLMVTFWHCALQTTFHWSLLY